MGGREASRPQFSNVDNTPCALLCALRRASRKHSTGAKPFYYNCTSTIAHYVESNSANIARVHITRVRVVSSRASGREAPLPSARASLTPLCPRAGHQGNVKATFDHSRYHSLKISSILSIMSE